MSALEFRERGKGGQTVCSWPGHKDGRRGSGRYRMAICGHPIRTAAGFELLVCERCKTELEETWCGAREPEKELAAA